jgi:ABC-type nitrate/sulfonate/bicarbonate transport system substrate-binding protein
MTRGRFLVLVLVGVGVVACLGVLEVAQLIEPPAGPADVEPAETGLVRIGYSSLTPLHCALGEVLRNTDVLARHGLEAELTYFPHGKDQHEACSRGVIDATFSCEVPAMVHLDRLPGLVLTASPGELGDIALVVPAASDVTSVEQLRGLQLAVLGGASSEMVLDQWLAGAGLDRQRDLHAQMHGGIGETAVAAVVSGDADAAVLWDPWLTRAQLEHGLRVVEAAPFWSVVALYEGRIEDEARYHAAVADALGYVAAHTDEVAGWVEARSEIPAEVVVAVLRKNRFVADGQPVDLQLPEETLSRLRQCETHALATGRVGPAFQLGERMRLIQ